MTLGYFVSYGIIPRAVQRQMMNLFNMLKMPIKELCYEYDSIDIFEKYLNSRRMQRGFIIDEELKKINKNSIK